ncbi:hypothetical protein TBLA_0H02440 [Henningerozyma blattae CBS 6284]|uniref:Uncharacterized protein n=1 Tax=Henningerozyma blattae (strain ATCC 34711 / CBS 6284 / DSM 70876 / NBRC 10599 / NRRL Y-10934 / UCD 77-7) TaxID=1071380 RepID=I2H826_HENB6|nr:hypothetical protein TBLA_0H02440 [Tetrapisispora blattae CBS 6284]CCH62528.1 hypothetical protein TBLA_0H02440 [Tetrapisispora blattae CBS 6284]
MNSPTTPLEEPIILEKVLLKFKISIIQYIKTLLQLINKYYSVSQLIIEQTNKLLKDIEKIQFNINNIKERKTTFNKFINICDLLSFSIVKNSGNEISNKMKLCLHNCNIGLHTAVSFVHGIPAIAIPSNDSSSTSNSKTNNRLARPVTAMTHVLDDLTSCWRVQVDMLEHLVFSTPRMVSETEDGHNNSDQPPLQFQPKESRGENPAMKC